MVTNIAYTDITNVHYIGLLVLVLCVLYLITTTRDKAILAVLFMVLAIPSAQRIVIVSLDFSFIRIILLVALARIYLRKENQQLNKSAADTIIIIWAIWSILAFGFLVGQMSGVITRTGYMIDVVGGYLVGRAYIRNSEDLKRVIVFLGVLAIPVAVFFLVERITGKNVFSVFGGVPLETLIRDGRLRCQGPFSHPIMAGIFWAGVLPWLGALWLTHKIPLKSLVLYLVFIMIIIVNTASSTPVMSVIFVVFGLALFSARHLMPIIRAVGFFTLIVMHLIMEKGIHHLIARIDVAGGSSGWHRYYLIDQAYAHLGEWWLLGTLSTAHWGRGLSDVTNQFLLEGVRGGLISMMLFILFFVAIYINISSKIKTSKTISDVWLLWATGVLVFMHLMNFLAVSYFGQMTSALFLFLGGAVSLINNDQRISTNIKLENSGSQFS